MGSIAESHGRAAGICEIHSGDHRDAQSSSHDFISVSAVCIPSDSVGRYRCPFAIYCRKRTNSAGRRGRSSDCPLCRWRNARCDFPVRPVCSSFRGSDYAGSRCGGSWCIGSSTAVSDSGRCPSKSAGRCIERSRCLVSRLERYGKTLRGVDRTAAEYDAAESRQCSGRIAELSAGGTPTAAGTDQSGDDGTNLACNFCFAGLPRTDAAKSGQTNRIGIGVDSADTASNGTNTACSDASSSPSTKTDAAAKTSCPAGRSANAIACTTANAHPNTDYTGTDSTCFPVGRYFGGIPECESGSFRQPCGIGCLYSGRNALNRCKESVFPDPAEKS